MIATAAFIVGLIAGAWLVERKWRSNADQPFRIESGGRIYKVHHADTF